MKPKKQKEVVIEPNKNSPEISKGNITNPLGRLSLISYMDDLYKQRLILDPNTIDHDDYIKATAVLRAMMDKGNRKERVDSAKLVFNRGRPSMNINVSFLVQSSLPELVRMKRELLQKLNNLGEGTSPVQGEHLLTHQVNECTPHE